MPNVFTLAADRFLGRGEASVAIPPMDGALKPNSAVDKADHLLAIARPDNLLRADNSVLFSSGRQLLAVSGNWSKPEPVVECEAEILATAAAPDGSIAIFDAVRGLSLLDMSKRSMVRRNIARLPFASVTAATFRDADTLLVCVGSTRNPVTEWQRDLLEFGRRRGRSGRSTFATPRRSRSRRIYPIRRAASCRRTEKARWFPRAGKIAWC